MRAGSNGCTPHSCRLSRIRTRPNPHLGTTRRVLIFAWDSTDWDEPENGFVLRDAISSLANKSDRLTTSSGHRLLAWSERYRLPCRVPISAPGFRSRFPP